VITALRRRARAARTRSPQRVEHHKVESRRTETWFSIMTNNCVIASAAAAADQGLSAEVLSDATGAINIANDAGHADAQSVHTTIMTLLHSNFAAVSSTAKWTEAVLVGAPLPKSDLVTSATTGTQRASHA
jgi:hypothetical protein